MQTLAPQQWSARAAEHRSRADELTAAHRARRAARIKHPVEDFLYDYYGIRPGRLRRWHPGVGTRLAAGQRPPEHASWRWYRTEPDGAVSLDVAAYLTDRRETVTFVAALLEAITDRRPFHGCFALHEWAMVYRQQMHRHDLPLRLGQAATDELVETMPVQCSHYDAYRFFTPDAVPLNRVRPTRATQVAMEQSGCLHAAMDTFKWALKLGPVVPGEVVLACFALARSARDLDMRASPYEVGEFGLDPVPVETADGRAQFVEEQRVIADEAAPLRRTLLSLCRTLLQD